MNHTPLSLHHKGKQQRNKVNFRHTKFVPSKYSVITSLKKKTRHLIHSLSSKSMYIRKACNQIEKQAHVPLVKQKTLLQNKYLSFNQYGKWI